MGWSMFYPCLCACRSVRTSVLSFLKGLYNQFGMLSKSLNMSMQCFAEFCIGSQFACAEIGDNGRHKKYGCYK